jgi:putative ABC transport system permease protein
MFGVFSAVAIFVAGLGIFGLSLFNAVRRTKEIGIRKVLGATWREILAVLIKDFVILVIIANIVALPLAFFAINKWLTKYPFRIAVRSWFFIIPVLATIAIAVIVSAWHSVRAALADPVNALRHE